MNEQALVHATQRTFPLESRVTGIDQLKPGCVAVANIRSGRISRLHFRHLEITA